MNTYFDILHSNSVLQGEPFAFAVYVIGAPLSCSVKAQDFFSIKQKNPTNLNLKKNI